MGRPARTVSPARDALYVPGDLPVESGGILIRIHGGWLDARIPAIARRLATADRDLLLLARASEDTRQIECYELTWRGQYVASWTPLEVGQIESDVAAMRVDAAGHIPARERLRSRRDAHDAQRRRRYREALAPALEHMIAFVDEREHGKAFFGQAGRG